MKLSSSAFSAFLSGAVLVGPIFGSSSSYNEDDHHDILHGVPLRQSSLGNHDSCAIDNLNNLKCWGDIYGVSKPTLISLDSEDATYATQISLGGYHACAIDNLNNLKCWGSNYHGQIGDGTTVDKSTPTLISLHAEDAIYVTQIELGGAHSCAIDNLNGLRCWGENFYGQLGDGTYRNKKSATNIISLGDDETSYATHIALGRRHTCAINNFNSLLCWGGNLFGQLGDGTLVDKIVPTTISIDDNETNYATQIALGQFHTCAIDNFNNLKCWGQNFFGQIGDGTNLNMRVMPTTISLGDDEATYPTKIALGGDHTCAIDNLNNLKCWGKNWYGEVGDGTNDLKDSPTNILLGDDETADATHIALGRFHTCAIKDSNMIFCWGQNKHGEIGDGTDVDKYEPTLIPLDQPFLDGGNIKEERAFN